MEDRTQFSPSTRAAIDRLGLQVDDVPRADPLASQARNRHHWTGDPFFAAVADRLAAPPAEAQPDKLTPDHVTSLAEDIATIRRLDALIELLHARRVEYYAKTLGEYVREALGAGKAGCELPEPIILAHLALDGIIADATTRRAEIAARVAPYVESFQQ